MKCRFERTDSICNPIYSTSRSGVVALGSDLITNPVIGRFSVCITDDEGSSYWYTIWVRLTNCTVEFHSEDSQEYLEYPQIVQEMSRAVQSLFSKNPYAIRFRKNWAECWAFNFSSSES